MKPLPYRLTVIVDVEAPSLESAIHAVNWYLYHNSVPVTIKIVDIVSGTKRPKA
jgi:hypothetical protein